MHICHLITGLGPGGTPVMLRKVLETLRHTSLRFTVIGMIDENDIGRQIEALGIPVHYLGMRPGRVSLRGFRRLIKLLRADPPDLLQTWLYHADLLGSFAAPFCGRPPLVWNIRHATLTPGVDSRSTLWAARASGWMSSLSPRAIVINTESGQNIHAAAGYARSKFRLIPNGFDLDRFSPSPEARDSLRTELGIPSNAPLVGLIARYSPLKGHDVFLKAMRQVAAARHDVHFLLCGRETSRENRELAAAVDASEFPERWHLLGPRQDIPRIQAALDLAVCPSVSEAFSNSIGEAMACGVPCVATDIGDSSRIVGSAGRIVPVGDAAALANAVLEVLQLPAEDRRLLSTAARQRIEESYDIRRIASAYHDLWHEFAKDRLQHPHVSRRAA